MIQKKTKNIGFRYIVRACIENEKKWYLMRPPQSPKRTTDILKAQTFERSTQAEHYAFLCRNHLATRLDCPFEVMEIIETRVLTPNPVMSKISSYYCNEFKS